MKEVPCGIYRTTRPIGDGIAAGVLVYYHNHGDPGPGLYLPRSWQRNRAIFAEQGTTIPDPAYPESLQALLPEGLYRVGEGFACCEKRCLVFEEDQLLQLGYDGRAQAILFTPELIDGELRFPERGTVVEESQLQKLRHLKVSTGSSPAPPPLHLN